MPSSTSLSTLEVMVNPCPDLNKIACQITFISRLKEDKGWMEQLRDNVRNDGIRETLKLENITKIEIEVVCK